MWRAVLSYDDVEGQYLSGGDVLSLLKNPTGQGIGLAMKTATDDVRCSKSAPLSCDAVSPHEF